MLASINVVDNIDRAAFVTLAPDIRRSFGLSQAAMTGIAGISSILVVLAALPIAVLADRGSRLRIAGLAAAFWSVLTLLTGLAATAVQLTAARIVSGLGQAAIEPVHGSLLTDYYAPEQRGRAFSLHQFGLPLAGILGPAVAGAIGAVAGWRWAFLAVAPVGLVFALMVRGLREPARGSAGAAVTTAQVPAVRVPWREGMRTLLAIPSLRNIYLAIGMLGFGLVGAPVIISDHLQSALGLDSLARGAVLAFGGLGMLVGLVLGGTAADRLYRRDPSLSLYVAGAGLAAFTVLGAVALHVPWTWLVLVLLTASQLGSGLVVAPIRQVVAGVSPAHLSALAFAMLGIFILLFGGFLGGVLLGALADAYGAPLALTALTLPGTAAALLVARAAHHTTQDLTPNPPRPQPPTPPTPHAPNPPRP
ncbi:MFS transporter [Actinocorallia sp. A-T 12471]|uniref:MFS transporter n=1 Tax=Actinocorallia sp. A-T 12471 TaxID=3089813 RepID=UPI0029D16653|nr:MFS transporter [Actinocorallia sp. A-T 12471]MDX6742744.1 MFS transporter [Actinocorallia sp. A-T 12471]